MVKKEDYFQTRDEDGQFAFVLDNSAILRNKATTKLVIFFFSFDCNN